MPFPKGTHVKQVVPVITGEVLQTRWNDDSNQFEHLVQYHDASGEVERWFTETEVEAM